MKMEKKESRKQRMQKQEMKAKRRRIRRVREIKMNSKLHSLSQPKNSPLEAACIMFNRLVPKRQCIRSYNIAGRSICGLVRSHEKSKITCCPQMTLNEHRSMSSSFVSSCSPSYCSNSPTTAPHTLPPQSYQHHIRRHFGAKIKVYNQPDVGEGTVEVDILEWLIKPGDKVKALQTIGRGKYEKADVDILAPTYNGTVHKILVEAGTVAIVGKPLVEFEVDDDGSTSSAPSIDEESSTSIDSATMAKQTSSGGAMRGSSKGILALPATKHFAKEHGIDLSEVVGSGKDGRILKEDVIRYMDGAQTATPSTPSIATGHLVPPSPPKVMKPPTKAMPARDKLHGAKADTVEKYTVGVRKAMVKKMTEANSVPMFGYGDEIIMNELVNLRKQLKPMAESYGVKLTFLPFILKATSLALSNPQSHCLNAHINAECTELTHRGSHNIGVAIDSGEGLIVPNVKHVDQKSILEIAQDLEDLIERGRNNQITTEDVTGGTVTLSNIGAIGGTYCRPICFVPEVLIGALGTIKQFPRYNDKSELFKASVMAISWSADHRVIDGATVARFSNEFKNYLENPSAMLMHLK
mmetsp:Transcript_47117/g.75491  ORF Transcript_47117/g.75491 Transcript_47117/m.75491 type:complete len:580 (+) Transcript_47117:778-2517(+)